MKFNLRNEATKQYNGVKSVIGENIIKKEGIPIIHISKEIIENFDFDFDNYKIQKLFFSNSTINNFDYDNVIDLGIINNNIGEISFLDCLFNDKFIKGIKPNGSFHFSNNKNLLNVFRIKYNNKINRKGIMNFHNFRILEFIISNQNIKNKVSKFKKIRIYNNIELKSFLIENIIVEELTLENINNNFESFEIRNCVIGKLVIRNSNLGKAVFNGVTIKELEIENTTLNDCIFNGVDFNDNYKLIEFEKEKGLIDYKLMKDNYRQLKHVMDKNANYTEANNFYALEMEYHMKSLTFTKKELFTDFWNLNINSNKLRVFGEFIILLFSKIINNFGTNIIQNLIVLSIFSGIFSIGKYIYVDKEQYYTTFRENLIRMQNDYSNNFDIFGEIGAISIFFGGLLLALLLIGLFIKLTSKNILLGIIAYIFFMGITVHDEIFFNFINLLLNPTYGFKLIPNLDNSFHLAGLLIYKLFYGILIYQLIIALKRTTKR